MDEERIVAYYAREMWYSREQYGDPQWLRQTLLRDDVVKPLLIDKVVWKSLFQSNIHVNGQMAGTALDSPSPEIPVEHRAHWFYSWASLQALQATLSMTYMTPDFPPCWLIAVSIFDDSSENVQLIEPAQIRPEWQFLGYDVAEDAGMWSKLSGFIFSPDEAQLLQRQFAEHINQYHLFTAYEPAEEYCEWADERDEGHSPNFVFGLYFIETFPKS